MQRLVPIWIFGVAALFGCGKQEAPQPLAAPVIAPRPPAEEVASSQPVSVPSAPASAAPTEAGTAAVVNYVPGTTAFDDLSRHLVWFVGSKRRFPTDVDELLTASRLPKPVLPPGGRLVINKEKKTVDYVGPR